MSLIDESGERYVRMAHLATVGSHAVNGVAELHSKLLRETTLRDFAELWPDKFLNVTNGVTPRRFLVLSNPRLTTAINRKLGDHWIRHLTRLRQLESLADEAEFRAEIRQVKQANKIDFAAYLKARTDLTVDPAALFDVQVKRFHEYKRQHLNLLHVISLYQRINENPGLDVTPRLFLFGGKAAPGYYMAKLIIKLINSVAEVVNHDPQTRDRLKVVFLPDYNVKQVQRIYPAADLSEQISTAGYEASGTSNMKFALNGGRFLGRVKRLLRSLAPFRPIRGVTTLRASLGHGYVRKSAKSPSE
jgi:starch phosphorylase